MLKDDILKEMQRRQAQIPQRMPITMYHQECIKIMFEVAAEVLAALPAASGLPVYSTKPKD